MTHEFELIGKLRQQLSEFLSLEVGPGDDAAVSLRPDGSRLLLATDMLLEGVHFDLSVADSELVGRKALAVNLSDIAAMGGIPEAALVSIAVPKGRAVAEPLMHGLLMLAEEFDVDVAGGDTTSWIGPLVVNVAVTGRLESSELPFLRSGAQPGDWVFVTGRLGGSRSGHHLQFTPRVREGRMLRGAASVHAMIDISDGLAADLHHVLRESSTGAVLYENQIPRRYPDTTIEQALSDGEDFELLFTVPAEEGQSLLGNPPAGVDVFHIGEITESGAVLRRSDGTESPLEDSGWKHEL